MVAPSQRRTNPVSRELRTQRAHAQTNRASKLSSLEACVDQPAILRQMAQNCVVCPVRMDAVVPWTARTRASQLTGLSTTSLTSCPSERRGDSAPFPSHGPQPGTTLFSTSVYNNNAVCTLLVLVDQSTAHFGPPRCRTQAARTAMLSLATSAVARSRNAAAHVSSLIKSVSGFVFK